MKQKTFAMIGAGVMFAASLGVAQAAGRAVDNPRPMHETTPTAEEEGPIGGGYIYTGRPNDNRYVERPRGEGDAEFAVMDVEGEAERVPTAYHGRPMDNPHLAE